MAETVKIYKAYSTGPTYAELNKTGGYNDRLITKDLAPSDGSASFDDTTYPIKIPTVDAPYYSFWASYCLDLSGTFTKITNIKHYSDGSIGWNCGTGGGLYRGNRDSGDDGCPLSTDYDQATGSEGTCGDNVASGSAGHAYYNGQSSPTADVASDTSGSPATIDSSDHTGAGKSKGVVLQAKVMSDATHGSQTAETLTWTYDVI